VLAVLKKLKKLLKAKLMFKSDFDRLCARGYTIRKLARRAVDRSGIKYDIAVVGLGERLPAWNKARCPLATRRISIARR
jgi:hypothetical protein